jgi:hypothetical protein
MQGNHPLKVAICSGVQQLTDKATAETQLSFTPPRPVLRKLAMISSALASAAACSEAINLMSS